MNKKKFLKAIRLVAMGFVAAFLIADGASAQQKYPIESKGEGQTGSKYTQPLASMWATSPATRCA